jgi:hypothetical protein
MTSTQEHVPAHYFASLAYKPAPFKKDASPLPAVKLIIVCLPRSLFFYEDGIIYVKYTVTRLINLAMVWQTISQ